MSGGIWVFAEMREGTVPESSLEAVAEGRRLAGPAAGGKVTAVLLGGKGAAGAAGLPAEYGADRTFWAEEERFSRYSPEAFTAVIAGLVSRHEPSVFLLSATDVGKDLAPRLAARLKGDLAPGCDRLEMSPEGLLVRTRLSHGRKVHVTSLCRGGRLQMATLEPGAFKARKAAPPGRPELVRLAPGISGDPEKERQRVVGFIEADPATVDIADAGRIVAGGKGAGDEEGFGLVRELAESLGASVAGSRAAVDLGCLTRERQIGQSGRTVSPALLISCGISGANAHVAGMRDSRTIVAINTDRNAPILKMADLAVVGNLREILPILSERIRSRAAGGPDKGAVTGASRRKTREVKSPPAAGP